MREYRATDIRNVAVVGHGASGKTTLVDALAFVSGSSKRHGTIKEGTTLTLLPLWEGVRTLTVWTDSQTVMQRWQLMHLRPSRTIEGLD